MASFSLGTNSSLGYLGGFVVLSKRVGFEEREVSPIGGSLNSESTRSSHELVRVERDVEFVEPLPTTSNNREGVNEVAPLNELMSKLRSRALGLGRHHR